MLLMVVILGYIQFSFIVIWLESHLGTCRFLTSCIKALILTLMGRLRIKIVFLTQTLPKAYHNIKVTLSWKPRFLPFYHQKSAKIFLEFFPNFSTIVYDPHSYYTILISCPSTCPSLPFVT